MGLVKDALSIFQTRGAHHFCYRFGDWINWRFREAADAAFGWYGDIKPSRQQIEIEDISATFNMHSNHGGRSIRKHRTTEYELLTDMISHIKSGDIVYDIGANVGFYSVFASQLCSEVVAFEPYPPNFRQLKRNISYNKGSVRPYNIALSDKNETVGFTAPESAVGHGTGRIGGNKFKVKTRRGDDLVADEGLIAPDIVKIDVEGAEGMVIDGMDGSLRDCRRIYVELHLPAEHRTSGESYDRSPTETIRMLHDIGFDTRIVRNRGEEIQLVGSRDALAT
jgi:FkbM family methyltransferase